MAQQGVSSTGGGSTQARPVTTQSRAPAKQQPGPAPTPGKRYIRTAAGAARYKKPVGSEIVAAPRDQRGQRAQSDRESTDRYKGLVSGDPETQRKAMAGLNEDQLKRLSEVAFSFSSNDPAVARLRAGITLEMRSRGLDVNRYGGLAGRGSSGGQGSGGSSSGGGSVTVKNWATGESYQVATKAPKASPASRKAATDSAADERRALGEAVAQETKRRQAAAKAERDRVAAAKKVAVAQAAAKHQQEALERTRMRNQNRQRRTGPATNIVRLTELDLAVPNATKMREAVRDGEALPDPKGDRPGHFNIRNVGELRDAVRAFGRVRDSDRENVARFICKRAKALNAEHLLGPAVRSAAGYDEDKTDLSKREPLVVDLSGKWKHGWVPLDAAAVSAKTHGRKGAKPWWDGGAKGRTGTPTGRAGRRSSGESSEARSRRLNSGLSDKEYNAKHGVAHSSGYDARGNALYRDRRGGDVEALQKQERKTRFDSEGHALYRDRRGSFEEGYGPGSKPASKSNSNRTARGPAPERKTPLQPGQRKRRNVTTPDRIPASSKDWGEASEWRKNKNGTYDLVKVDSGKKVRGATHGLTFSQVHQSGLGNNPEARKRYGRLVGPQTTAESLQRDREQRARHNEFLAQQGKATLPERTRSKQRRSSGTKGMKAEELAKPLGANKSVHPSFPATSQEQRGKWETELRELKATHKRRKLTPGETARAAFLREQLNKG